MGLYETLMARRSVRHFEDRPVPEPILEELLDVANNAPSGGNIQPLSIIVVRDPARRAKLAEIVAGQPWVRNAPLSLIFCIDFHRVKAWARSFDVEFRGESALSSFLIAYADVMCAAQNVVVLAQELGLGSVYIGTILCAIGEARREFELPDHVVPMMVLTIGYPKSIPKRIPKLESGVVVHHERYRTLSDDEIARAFETKYGAIDDDAGEYLKRAFVEVVEADKQQEESWVADAKEAMKRLEIRSNAQFLFELRYPQDQMVALNSEILESLREAGFDLVPDMQGPDGT
jgi:FMN reductase [NAD(P)H]